MMRTVLRSKLHHAVVTEATLHYEGSITVDADLMAAADIAPYEQVLVASVTNGTRFQTYAIPGAAGSGVIGLNGGAARLGKPGDTLIVMAFGLVPEDEVRNIQPRIVLLDANNRIRLRPDA
jgi:aspartate 1-decarboxylase